MGVNDPDELSRQLELQARVRKLAGAMVKPLEYDPGAQFPDPEPAKAAQVIQPSEFIKPAFIVLTAWALAEGGRGQRWNRATPARTKVGAAPQAAKTLAASSAYWSAVFQFRSR